MKTLKRLFKIIKLLEENSELRIQDISDILNINKSTIFRFVKILESYGFVSRNEETKKYSLGLYVVTLASKVIERFDIIKIARPHLKELGDITGETIHITVFNGREVVYLEKVECKSKVSMKSSIGGTALMYCTGVGKAILAFQDKKTIEKLVNEMKLIKLTKNTIISKSKLIKELEKSKKNGFVIDKYEQENDVCCIAVPIRDYSGKTKYAMSIASIKSRMDIDSLIEHKDLLIKTGAAISKQMGYYPGNN
jgi:IclR family KDG regulon transcriptional repressor